MDLVLDLSVLLVLFFFSAFFSGSETALTSLSRYRLKKIATMEKSLKKVLSKWLAYPQQILVIILIGNTVVNIFISALATLTVLRIFSNIFRREILEFATWILVTFLILLFGEILPKIYSRSNPEQVTLKTAKPLGILSRILFPFIKPVMLLVDKFVPNMAFLPMGKITSLTIEEIRNIVLDSSSRGLLYKETGEMLEGVLKLGQMKVDDIMVPARKVDSVNIEQGSAEVINKLVEIGRSRIPVYKGDRTKIKGVVLLKDLLSKTNILSSDYNIAEFPSDIVRPAYFIPPNKKVSELLYEFQRGVSNCAVVVDKSEKLKGFVTLEDILEEIVGEILDEYDVIKSGAEIEAEK
jgi:CBS domain containing-hemolysin-like protein